MTYGSAMKFSISALTMVAAVLLAACSNQVPLSYAPTSTISAEAIPAIGQVAVADQRGEYARIS
jgi:hypothetical protein